MTAGTNGIYQSQYEIFDFSDISILSGVSVTVVGSAPLILLAQTTALIDGTVDVSGQNGGNGFMGAGIASGSGAGGGGGGVVAIFAGTQLTVGGTGQIPARGGDGGTGDDPSQTTGLGGAGGSSVSGGAPGGAGGSLSAGGMGGMGGSGTPFGGGGGGGGGPTLVAGGMGGDGGTGKNNASTMGKGGAGGNLGANPVLAPKVGGNSTFGGGGGGGGGGDCFASATCVVGKGGAGGVGGSGKAGGADGGVKGEDGMIFSPLPGQGAPGAGGAVILGADANTVEIDANAVIDATRTVSRSPINAFSPTRTARSLSSGRITNTKTNRTQKS